MSKSTCVIVLGGHRTGTSAVAGVLHRLGCTMGPKLLGPNRYNVRGHYEDLAFLKLNKMATGDWRDPRPRMSARLRKGYDTIIGKRCQQKLWGIKDPRFCFTLPLIIDLFAKHNCRVMIVAVYRKHEASAKSMARRRSSNSAANRIIRINYDRALALARRYEKAQKAFLESFEGPQTLIQYERLCKKPKMSVEHIAGFIKRPVTAQALKFVEPKLKHF